MALDDLTIFQEKIRQLREFLHKRNGQSLKIFTDECAEFIMIMKDDRFVILSTIAYSFSKFYEKPYIGASVELAELSQLIDADLARAEQSAEGKDDAGVGVALADAENKVKDLSAKLGRYIINITFKARLKTAANVYAHGSSLGSAAVLCGVDKDELGNYIGHTTIHEKYKTMDVHERMNLVFAALGR